MPSPLKSQLLVLMVMMLDSAQVTEASGCAAISVESSVVVLGSTLRASCAVRDNCTLAEGPDVQLEWRLNGSIVPRSRYVQPAGSRVSALSLPGFNATQGYLACFLVHQGEPQMTDEVEIKAGYPPSKPMNLSCMTNLTNPPTFTCTWMPGRETHLPTRFSLHTRDKVGNPSKSFMPPDGSNSYSIPRLSFHLFSEMEVFVTAVNALGSATSDSLFQDPMDAVKLDPPNIQSIRTEDGKYGCLIIEWTVSDSLDWVGELEVDLRFKATDSERWTTERKTVVDWKPVQQCALLHGTEYEFLMRVRLDPGFWSDWSRGSKGYMLEKAPSGKLSLWWRMMDEQSRVLQLVWKPTSQFKANSKNVSYHVFHGSLSARTTFCRTSEMHCEACLPRGTKKLYISAMNAAGESNPAEVTFYQDRALEPVSGISVSSYRHTGLWVHWTPLASQVVNYVVEWCVVSDTEPCLISFLVVPRNHTSAAITENVEPYRLYRVSVYPLYRNGIGRPLAAEGYSEQKAPSTAPAMEVGAITDSQVELSWQEIPVDERNGFIRSYTVFYSDEGGDTEGVIVESPQRHVTLRNLKPSSLYKVFIMASSEGGSANGTLIMFRASEVDSWNFLSTVLPACIGLLVFSVVTLSACFTKRDSLKLQFWPMVPDPANSSLHKWTQTETLKDINPFQDLQDPSPVNISRFSILDISGHKSEKEEQKPDVTAVDGPWPSQGRSIGLDGTPPASAPFERRCEGTQAKDYLNYSGVPYATVVFSAYKSQQGAPPAYLRSDSTQPLLQDLSPSPKQYENLWFSANKDEDASFIGSQVTKDKEVGSSAFWDDFPLLSALKIEETDIESVS